MSGHSVGISLLDLSPPHSEFLAQAIAGLSASPRTLPCKFFYDEHGSELFGRICELPEYYITRTELQILRDHGTAIASAFGPRISLIGLGTGAGTKTRLLLEELDDPVAYIPVDISRELLRRSTTVFHRQFPQLEILPVSTDYLQPFSVPASTRQAERKVVYFPGSTIGNFEPADAAAFLRRLCEFCGNGGGLLIGVDLQKEPAVIERAYNDEAGVTAAFNLNLLTRANRELGADFDLSQWRHRAIYNPVEGRIEMYLISLAAQRVCLGDREFFFAPEEKITTEFSYKHSPDGFRRLAADAGFTFEKLWTDDAQLFGLFYFTVQS